MMPRERRKIDGSGRIGQSAAADGSQQPVRG
jgi:hypothetical protein